MEIKFFNPLKPCKPRKHGYFLVNRGGRFYAQRSRHRCPKNAHWEFILMCAKLTEMGIIQDMIVTAGELDDALEEMTDGQLSSLWCPRDAVVSPAQVLYLKSYHGL